MPPSILALLTFYTIIILATIIIEFCQMEKKFFSSHHTSSPATPRRDRKNCPHQETQSRKPIVESMERMRKQKLQKQLEERQGKLTKYLQQKQEGVQRENSLKHTKSAQWFQKVKNKNKISAFGCPQLFERDQNAFGKDRKQTQTVYFNKKNGILRKRKQIDNKNSTCTDSLPSISKEATLARVQELDLIDLGIFTAREHMESFLRRFRSTLLTEFKGGVDVTNIFDIKRLQYHFIREIRLDQ